MAANTRAPPSKEALARLAQRYNIKDDGEADTYDDLSSSAASKPVPAVLIKLQRSADEALTASFSEPKGDRPPMPVTPIGDRMSFLEMEMARMSLDAPVTSLPEIAMDEQVGQGAYGDVFRVVHRATGQPLAMKVISMLHEERAIMERTLAEVRMLRAATTCENVVKFCGAFCDGTDLHILMEFMDEGSLEEVYRRAGGIDEAHMGPIVLSVLRGLAFLLDELHVLHRDLKPANILLNSKGEVKLCDLGISKVLTKDQTQTLVGSKAYMSPERINETTYDARADSWSLGICVIEAALGVYPYVGWPLAILQSIASGEKPQRKLPKDKFSHDMRAFVNTCLTVDVAARPRPYELVHHKWLREVTTTTADMAKWLAKLPSAAAGLSS